MSSPEPEVKRWTAKRKTQVLDILKGKTTVAEIARRYDLKPSEIEGWVEEGIRSMENGLRARPRELRLAKRGNAVTAEAALEEALGLDV